MRAFPAEASRAEIAAVRKAVDEKADRLTLILMAIIARDAALPVGILLVNPEAKLYATKGTA